MRAGKGTGDAGNMALFGLTALFSPPKLTQLESQVLSAVSARLSPMAKEIFTRQIGLVNSIQRFSKGKDVNLRIKKRGKQFLAEELRFPLRPETLLATVGMGASNAKVKFKAEVWLVNGRVFSIEFNKPPRDILKVGANITEVKILHDPMIPASDEAVSDAARRENLLRTIQSKLPEEYLELVGEGKGLTINDWVVNGIQNIRKIVLRDGDYYLLAEKIDMGAVGVRAGEASGQVYYLDYGDDRGEKISVSLREFFEKFDGGRVTGRF